MENEGGRGEFTVGAPENIGETAFAGAETPPLTETENLELSNVAAEEKVPIVLPPMSVGLNDDETMNEAGAPEVGRDAEKMPKEYVKHTISTMRKYRRDPHALQESVTDLKWNYMEQAFNRKLGDGLHGKAAA